MSHNLKTISITGIKNEKIPKNHFIRSDLTVNDLKYLRNADISACNADELVDLRNVETNRKKPLGCRVNEFFAQVGNPYLFRVDDVVVKVEFGDGKDFSEMLTDVILAG
jgi:hypothetical protein